MLHSVIWVTSTYLTIVTALDCHVCKPGPVYNEGKNMLLAKVWLDQMNSTFGMDKFNSFGACSNFTVKDKKYLVTCPYPELESVCTVVKHGQWTARLCERLGHLDDMYCGKDSSGLFRCQCDNPYCNEASSLQMRSSLVLMFAMLVTVFVTLL